MTKLEKLLEDAKEAIGSHGSKWWNITEVITALSSLLTALKRESRRKNPTPQEPGIALFNFIPAYCPKCGGKISWKLPTLTAISEFKNEILYEGFSVTCGCCNIYFQCVDTRHLIEAATKQGGTLVGALAYALSNPMKPEKTKTVDNGNKEG